MRILILWLRTQSLAHPLRVRHLSWFSVFLALLYRSSTAKKNIPCRDLFSIRHAPVTHGHLVAMGQYGDLSYASIISAERKVMIRLSEYVCQRMSSRLLAWQCLAWRRAWQIRVMLDPSRPEAMCIAYTACELSD
jgi:hypothetical protein